METKAIGDWFKIVSFKHGGNFHRSWDKTCLIEENDEFIVLVNSHAIINEGDGRIWQARDPAISIFYKHKFINIICMIRQAGIYYYCNMASPYIIENNLLKYIDYDLDISMTPDKVIKILDEDEYAQHKVKLKYNDKIDVICRNALNEIHHKMINKEFPFHDDYVYQYYDKYCALTKK